jgi:hypothetical protein
MVDGVGVPVDEPGTHRAVDETDGAVVSQQQCGRYVTDRWSLAVRMSPDREQELVVCGCDADGGCLLFAPMKELAESGPKVEEAPVVVVVGLVISHQPDIVLRYVLEVLPA